MSLSCLDDHLVNKTLQIRVKYRLKMSALKVFPSSFAASLDALMSALIIGLVKKLPKGYDQLIPKSVDMNVSSASMTIEKCHTAWVHGA